MVSIMDFSDFPEPFRCFDESVVEVRQSTLTDLDLSLNYSQFIPSLSSSVIAEPNEELSMYIF